MTVKTYTAEEYNKLATENAALIEARDTLARLFVESGGCAETAKAWQQFSPETGSYIGDIASGARLALLDEMLVKCFLMAGKAETPVVSEMAKSAASVVEFYRPREEERAEGMHS